jgi:hypothetical protein
MNSEVTANPGDRVQVIRGRFDGLQGILMIGKFPKEDNAGGLIVIQSDAGKNYLLPARNFEVKEAEETEE